MPAGIEREHFAVRGDCVLAGLDRSSQQVGAAFQQGRPIACWQTKLEARVDQLQLVLVSLQPTGESQRVIERGRVTALEADDSLQLLKRVGSAAQLVL